MAKLSGMTQARNEYQYLAQVGALPVRRSRDGTEVLLVTSRETRRWIIPKGWPMKGRKDHEAAALEAAEEAGVTGRVRKHPIGAYTYQKRLAHRVAPCRVMVYLLEVESQLASWRERDQRKRQWFPLGQAADVVSEPKLASLILALGPASARADSRHAGAYARRLLIGRGAPPRRIGMSKVKLVSICCCTNVAVDRRVDTVASHLCESPNLCTFFAEKTADTCSL